MWNERLRRRADELLLVTKAEDMERAKREGKLGIIFHFQGSSPVEKDLGLVEIFYRLGVRVMQLTYNVKDFVGDGCEETGNGGLSDFGKKLIREMNRVGMVVDLSHTGHRTTMEAMEVSQSPCVFSHSGCSAVFRSNRNIHDDQIKAVAAGRWNGRDNCLSPGRQWGPAVHHGPTDGPLRARRQPGGNRTYWLRV